MRPALPRLLHPAAWWLWGVGLATAASRTTNPFLLLLIIVVVGLVVIERREPGLASPLLPFLYVGMAAILFRIVMMTLFGGAIGGRVVLFTLPSMPLPHWTSGVRIGGAVTLEGLLAAVYEGLRLATMLACLGACNALASPRRLLRYVPATLYEIGTSVVVALTFAPQLVEDARRVRAARRLRGHSPNGPREVGRLAIPVLVGALDRSLDLAASMESRGYGRAVRRSSVAAGSARALTLVGMLGLVIGLYAVLDGTSPAVMGMPLLGLGIACLLSALVVGATRDRRSRYRRDPWRVSETLTVVCGLVPAVAMVVAASHDWAGVIPVQEPAAVPPVPLALVVAILVGVLPMVLTPVPPLLALAREHRAEQPHDQVDSEVRAA